MMNHRLCIRNKYSVTTIKAIRLQWAGHIVRMANDRTAETVLQGKPGGRRKAARPILRWLDCTENDRKTMGEKRGREAAGDSSAWLTILQGQQLNTKDPMPKKRRRIEQHGQQR